ncbi:exonuclease domain-containing protein [Streptomyces sp. NPDC005322]|uniref:exonuclease domain-containing protein n=1 Tax=Streptomyces sp. NPDC005322 TaxID=3157032 RepID=UPI0033B2C686
MKFLEARRIGWDTETTSTDPTQARIVTAALVGRGGASPDRVQTWLINPGVPIPPETTDIHGIDDTKAQAEGQAPKAALEEIADTMARTIAYGLPLVAFNTAYDWSVLHYELLRHGLPTVEERVGVHPLTLVDPHVIDKQCVERLRGAGQRKLKPTCERYGVELTDWHTAKADALAALLIAEAQFERYPQLNDMDPQQLFAAQRAWRAEQQAGLQEFLRKTNPDAYCAPEWPLVPHQAEAGER